MIADEEQLDLFFKGLADADPDINGNYIGEAPENYADYTKGGAAQVGWRLALEYNEGRLEGSTETTFDAQMIAFEVVNYITRATSNETGRKALHTEAKAIGLRLCRKLLQEGQGRNIEECGDPPKFQLTDLNGVRYFKLKGKELGLYGYRFEVVLRDWIDPLNDPD